MSYQAMNIREQIGYPEYILEDRNKHLDEEYSNVRTPPRGLQNLTCPLTPHPPCPRTSRVSYKPLMPWQVVPPCHLPGQAAPESPLLQMGKLRLEGEETHSVA